MLQTLNVVEAPAKFHMSLNVSDLERAVAFYRVLFGTAPAKCHDDYAKFEIDQPPTVFSLMPGFTKSGGALSHIGLRLTSEEQMRAIQRRLEAAGIPTRCQDDTRGCYALQTKVWVADPDQNFWEIYIVKEDLDPERVNRGLEGPAARQEPPKAPVVWAEPAEGCARIPLACASADEVRVGTALLAEAWRVLRVGGKVIAHAAAAQEPTALLRAVQAAGFVTTTTPSSRSPSRPLCCPFPSIPRVSAAR